jgi:prophage regulatory protein
MQNTEQPTDRFMREPEVRRITGLSRTTRWRLERVGKFPRRRQLSANAVGWLASEIRAWMADQSAPVEPEAA